MDEVSPPSYAPLLVHDWPSISSPSPAWRSLTKTGATNTCSIDATLSLRSIMSSQTLMLPASVHWRLSSWFFFWFLVLFFCGCCWVMPGRRQRARLLRAAVQRLTFRRSAPTRPLVASRCSLTPLICVITWTLCFIVPFWWIAVKCVGKHYHFGASVPYAGAGWLESVQRKGRVNSANWCDPGILATFKDWFTVQASWWTISWTIVFLWALCVARNLLAVHIHLICVCRQKCWMLASWSLAANPNRIYTQWAQPAEDLKESQRFKLTSGDQCGAGKWMVSIRGQRSQGLLTVCKSKESNNNSLGSGCH